MEIRLGSHYFRVGRKIGSGSFGSVHIAVNVRTGEEVAVKLESTRAKSQHLVYEAMLYRLLIGGVGVPKVHWYGVVGDLNVLVLDLLGPSLEDLLALRRTMGHRGFSLRTVVAIGHQVLERIELLHSKGLLHRDIKPQNFLLGQGSSAGRVHVIDLGLAKKYRDPKTQQHIAAREGLSPSGCVAFSSLLADCGAEQGRCDDLEAVGHMLIYLLCGKLPWLPTPADGAGGRGGQRIEEHQHRTAMRKRATSVEELCEQCPEQFAAYMRYCRGLCFDEQPDYAHLRGLLREALSRGDAATCSLEETLEAWVRADLQVREEASPKRASQNKEGPTMPSCSPRPSPPHANGDKVAGQLPALLGTLSHGGVAGKDEDARAAADSGNVGDDSEDENPKVELHGNSIIMGSPTEETRCPSDEENPCTEFASPVAELPCSTKIQL